MKTLTADNPAQISTHDSLTAVIIFDSNDCTKEFLISEVNRDNHEENIGKLYFPVKDFKKVEVAISHNGRLLSLFQLEPVTFKTGRKGYGSRTFEKTKQGTFLCRANFSHNTETNCYQVTVGVILPQKAEYTELPLWIKSQPEKKKKSYTTRAAKGQLLSDFLPLAEPEVNF